MLRNLEGWHIIVIAAVVILLFGTKKLPDAARGIGRSLRIFKSEMKSMQDDDATTTTTATATPAAPAPLPPTTPVAPPEAAGNADELRPETPPRVEG